MNPTAFPQEWVDLSSNVIVLIVGSPTIYSRLILNRHKTPTLNAQLRFTLKQLLNQNTITTKHD